MPALNSNLFIKKYKDVALDMLQLSFPQLTKPELEYAVDLAIQNNVQDHDVIVDNNYKKTKINTTLLNVSNYILSREPILTAYGVMYSKHGSVPNPIYSSNPGHYSSNAMCESS